MHSWPPCQVSMQLWRTSSWSLAPCAGSAAQNCHSQMKLGASSALRWMPRMSRSSTPRLCQSLVRGRSLRGWSQTFHRTGLISHQHGSLDWRFLAQFLSKKACRLQAPSWSDLLGLHGRARAQFEPSGLRRAMRAALAETCLHLLVQDGRFPRGGFPSGIMLARSIGSKDYFSRRRGRSSRRGCSNHSSLHKHIFHIIHIMSNVHTRRIEVCFHQSLRQHHLGQSGMPVRPCRIILEIQRL